MGSSESVAPISWRAPGTDPAPQSATGVVVPRRARRARRIGAVAVGGAVVAGVVTVATLAMASWLSAGQGSATARSTGALDSAITAETYAADLYPGATGSVAVRISNTNDYPVLVQGIAAGSSLVTANGCPAGSVTSDARPTAPTGLVQRDGTTVPIPAHSFGVYTLTTHMGATTPDACQYQTFTVPLTASLASTVVTP